MRVLNSLKVLAECGDPDADNALRQFHQLYFELPDFSTAVYWDRENDAFDVAATPRSKTEEPEQFGFEEES